MHDFVFTFLLFSLGPYCRVVFVLVKILRRTVGHCWNHFLTRLATPCPFILRVPPLLFCMFLFCFCSLVFVVLLVFFGLFHLPGIMPCRFHWQHAETIHSLGWLPFPICVFPYCRPSTYTTWTKNRPYKHLPSKTLHLRFWCHWYLHALRCEGNFLGWVVTMNAHLRC